MHIIEALAQFEKTPDLIAAFAIEGMLELEHPPQVSGFVEAMVESFLARKSKDPVNSDGHNWLTWRQEQIREMYREYKTEDPTVLLARYMHV